MTDDGDIRLRRALADLFRARRLELGISQQELADEVGYAQANISRFERGATWPTIPRLIGLARVLGFDVGVLDELDKAPNGAGRRAA